MSITPIDASMQLRILQKTYHDQIFCRPMDGIPPDLVPTTVPIDTILETILARGRALLTAPELAAAQLSYKMRMAKALQKESPLSPAVQKIFSQLNEVRKEFFPFHVNAFNILRVSIFTKLFDLKFISKLDKDLKLSMFGSSLMKKTYEEYIKHIALSLTEALYNIDHYLLTKEEISLKEAREELKLFAISLDALENFPHRDEEKNSLQKTWISDLKTLLYMLTQCINEPELFPLLLQAGMDDEITTNLVLDSSFRKKQKLLLRTLAYCFNIFIERQEALFSGQKSSIKKIPQKLQGLFLRIKGNFQDLDKIIRNTTLPAIHSMILLLEDPSLNTSEKICARTPIEIKTLLDLCERIEKSRNNTQKTLETIHHYFRTFCDDLNLLPDAFPEVEIFFDLVRHKDLWKKMILVNASFCFETMEKYMGAFTVHVKNLSSTQTQLEKCLSLCTIYPTQHHLVSKLDVIQTTHYLLLHELKEVPEINPHFNKLLENHSTLFMCLAGLLYFVDRVNHKHFLLKIKNTLEEHIQILEPFPLEKCSRLKTLVQTFAKTINEVVFPQLLTTLLSPSGSQITFKKTDFQFLKARLRESIEMITFELFDLESIPCPQFYSKLKLINQVLEKFKQKKLEILTKHLETQQLNIFALELLKMREDLDVVESFYDNTDEFFTNQKVPEQWMNTVKTTARSNYIYIQLFDQGNQAFFAYCNEVYFDSLAPVNESKTSPRIEIVEEAASAPIEEIEIEHVVTKPLEIKLFKDSKKDLETICRQLKSYSLSPGTDFLFRQERVQKTIENIQCYIPQIENLLQAFDQFPCQMAQALFSKLSNLIEQSGSFVASAHNVTGAINHRHDLLTNLKALGVEPSPTAVTLDGWSSTRYHYSDLDLSTDTVNLLRDLKSRKITVATARETLKQMIHDAYAFASGLLNSVAHSELQDSAYERAEVADASEALIAPITIDPLLHEVSTLVIRTQMSFSADRTAYIAQVSDNESFDDKRIRTQLVSSGCRIIKEALSNLSDLVKPVSSGITYALAENLLLNAALILERAGFITLARLNIVGKDNRHIVFSKPELLHDARELRFNHDLEKIFGVMNLEIIEARKDITTFFGNTVGGATRYLRQYKMGAALLLEEILFLSMIRQALREGGFFKEEEHRRLKELFGSSESVTPENVDIKLSQLMDIVNDKVARALELTAALLRHNLS